MPDYILHHMPGSCSRIALNALEEIGEPYREAGVALMRGDQRRPAFLALNPKGKVPVLLVDGAPMTELPVILFHLANAHRQAKLLPSTAAGAPTLSSLSDLVWFAGTLQPLANRIFRPGAIAPHDPDGVKSVASVQLAEHAERISERLGRQTWWHGEAWAISDVFLAWIFGVSAQCGFPLDQYNPLAAHNRLVSERASFQRALSRERTAQARDELSLPPGITL